MTTSNKPKRRYVRRLLNIALIGGVLGGLLFAAPVESLAAPAGEGKSAASVRYNRKSGKVKTKNTLDTKFKKAQKRAEAEKKKKVDMMTADQFARQKAAVAREIADKQIGILTKLLRVTETSDGEYPDLLFRLADHHLDKKAYFERQAGSLYEKIYDAKEAGKKTTANQLRQRQKKFEGQSKRSSQDAVKIYKVLVSKPMFRKFKRLDEAIYFYAFELGQLKREAEMQEAYLRLIREYPTSKYIPNAYLSFADYKFGQNAIPDALRLYQKIVDGYKDSPVYAYALYKMAWCYLNPIGTAEPQYTRSLDKFVATIKATLEGRAGNEANAKQLRRDARRDLVKAYVHSGKPSRAWDFFTRVGNGPKKSENMSRKMMELLAVAYFGEGMYTESSSVYKRLQQLFDNDAARCEWQGRVMVNALATDDKSIQWKETSRLASYWEEYKSSKFSKVVKKKCRDEARDTMRQMATVWHDEAEKTRRLETYDLSEKAYQAFMVSFPKDRDAYEMNYYYAEILWAQGVNQYNSRDRATKERGLSKFRVAHDEFVKVLERKPKGKYTKDAAYAQMLAMKNALEYDETGGRKKACKTNTEGVCVYRDKTRKKKIRSKDAKTNTAQDFPETPYTDNESRMLGAYDTYQKYVKNPKDKELPKIQYHRVKLMMEHNKFNEAKPLLKEVVKKFDGSIYAAWAAEMLIDLLTIQWTDQDNTPDDTVRTSEELELWATRLQKTKTWNHKEASRIKGQVPTLLAGIGWKKAEAYQEKGKQGDPEGYVKCAETYVTVYNDHEDHDRADTLIFNAARCYEAAYLVGMAIKMRNILLDRHKSSKHYQGTLKELGQNYQAIAYYSDAATRFEEYAAKYKGDKFTPEALQNAYLFRLGLGDDAKAQANMTKYEGLFKRKDPKTAAKIFWSKHDLLESSEARMVHAKQYLREYGTKGGVDRAVVANAAIGQILWRGSCGKGLKFDSCLSIRRTKATAGEKQRTKARKLRRKAKRKKGKKKGKKVDLPKYCGSATQGIITVHGRDGKRAAEAQRYFASALKLSTKNPNIPKDEKQRAEDYRNAVGMAMVYQADQKYEEYLTVNIPEGLRFLVEEWKKDSGLPKWEKEYKEQVKEREASRTKFSTFFKRKTDLGTDLIGRYAKVEKSGSPAWVLAAAARTAVLSQNFADQLYRAEVPAGFKTEDQYFAYCDELADQAAAPEKKATEAFTYCLQRSTKYQFFNTFSRMCEEELQQREPDKYPATNELFGTSVYTDSRLDVVGVQTDLSGGKKQADKGKKKKAKDSAEETGF